MEVRSRFCAGFADSRYRERRWTGCCARSGVAFRGRGPAPLSSVAGFPAHLPFLPGKPTWSSSVAVPGVAVQRLAGCRVDPQAMALVGPVGTRSRPSCFGRGTERWCSCFLERWCHSPVDTAGPRGFLSRRSAAPSPGAWAVWAVVYSRSPSGGLAAGWLGPGWCICSKLRLPFPHPLRSVGSVVVPLFLAPHFFPIFSLIPCVRPAGSLPPQKSLANGGLGSAWLLPPAVCPSSLTQGACLRALPGRLPGMPG